jgi:hypothetical protein
MVRTFSFSPFKNWFCKMLQVPSQIVFSSDRNFVKLTELWGWQHEKFAKSLMYQVVKLSTISKITTYWYVYRQWKSLLNQIEITHYSGVFLKVEQSIDALSICLRCFRKLAVPSLQSRIFCQKLGYWLVARNSSEKERVNPLSTTSLSSPEDTYQRI